ncbi:MULTISPECIES: protein kinase family protein [unclassified Synechocystis]|uniref:pili biogenisis serine/threonine protein kinase SpkE n=1 Tax=unclassified Synechocystis TaxID=2640012 RepID=UPI0004D1043F|nr:MULTISPECIES: protein kinase family protein [unclassified Synechocystis]AIE73716.1 Serine/threonine protein kinase [Synechocystis sp. PCC 6714]MCT0252275.1 protein kinase family protein [Synechocystis sp. CS-94]
MPQSLSLGQRLDDRYLIELHLGQNSLGQQYLAHDTHRFDEPCTIKVLTAPPGDKAGNLFKQQAEILYCLDHPQIANFREFFALGSELYLVQDFVEGQSYFDLLKDRRRQDRVFTELEVRQWWGQMLPVLYYLHSQKICYGQIGLSNIVRRTVDGLPVLVDFSHSQHYCDTPGEDQRDLRGLGLGAIALLTGEVNPNPPWENLLSSVVLSQEFRQLLLQLLAWPPLVDLPTLGDNLNNSPQHFLPTVADFNPMFTMPEQTDNGVGKCSPGEPLLPIIHRSPESSSSSPTVKTMVQVQEFKGFVQKLLILLGLMAIAMALGWGAGQLWLHNQQRAALEKLEREEPGNDAPEKTDLEIKNEIRARRLNLGISPQRFQTLVDDGLAFQLAIDPQQRLENSPNTNGTPPNLGSPEQQMAMTITVLDALEGLSREATRDFAQNNSGDRRRWIPRVNQLRLSSRSFYDLVNARFRNHLPMVSPALLGEPEFEQRPLAQIWNAMAFDSLASLEDESHYQRLSFDDADQLNLNGTLEPGEGYAYAITIPPTEEFSLQLTAPPTARISFYPPTGPEVILQNSAIHRWSGPTDQTGYYELVITSTAEEPIAFELELSIIPASVDPF